MPRSGQSWQPSLLTSRAEFAPIAPLLARLAECPEFPGPSLLTALAEEERLRRAPALAPLEFVSLPPKPRRLRRSAVCLDELYDGRIARLGQVPCLAASYHDLFNAVIFAAFPRAKRALHRRQFRALEVWATPGARSLPSRRTREQDALTLFDEGGSVVVCAEHLRGRFDSGGLDLARTVESEASLVLFGHALLEHLASGRADLRSSARMLWCGAVPNGAALLDMVDRRLCGLLEDPARFATPDADAVVEWSAGRLLSVRPFDPKRRAVRG